MPDEADPAKPRKGRAPQPLRWTLEAAAREFALNPRTLRNNLSQTNNVAGEDGKFSTRQIVGAVFTDYELERTAAMKAGREQAEFDLAKARGEVISTAGAGVVCSNVLFAIKRRIITSKLSAEEQDDILKDIEGFDVEKLIEDAKKEGEL